MAVNIKLKYKGVFHRLNVASRDSDMVYSIVASKADSLHSKATLIWKDSNGDLVAISSPADVVDVLIKLKKNQTLHFCLLDQEDLQDMAMQQPKKKGFFVKQIVAAVVLGAAGTVGANLFMP
uniref:PB1 domain-containing protein n=1 Tax=Plectus sambesii TaxID=2011161 RepID=A0A914UK95_9BILA